MTRGRLSLNVFMNMLSTVVNALSGFVTLPLLVGRLGAESYGLWTLIVAVAGYFLVLDFGVSSAVGRLVAASRARSDVAGLNAVLSTTLVLLLGVCALVVVASCFVPIPFFWFFHVPAAQTDDVRSALLLVGVTTALSFPSTVFSGFLWGYERFDLHNLVEIPVLLARLGLIVWLIGADSTLLDLAWILSGTSVAGFLTRVGLCWLVEPRICFGWRFFSRRVVSEVFIFGTWFSLLTFARAILPHFATFVIGHGLGSAAVTAFTIPRLLVAYSNWMLVSATEVIAPRAAVFHFGQQHTQQRDLFVIGGRYSLAVGLYLLGGLILLGHPLLSVWQPDLQGEEYRLLVILILGEILPLSQWVTYNTIVSMGRHRRLAIFGFAEGLMVLALAAALVSPFGLPGVAVAVAVAGFLFRGLLQWLYGCAVVGISPLRYAKRVFLSVTAATLIPLAALGAARVWITPETWFGVLSLGALYSLLYWPLLLLHLLGRQQAADLARSTMRIVAGRAGSKAARADLVDAPCVPQDRRRTAMPVAAGRTLRRGQQE